MALNKRIIIQQDPLICFFPLILVSYKNRQTISSFIAILLIWVWMPFINTLGLSWCLPIDIENVLIQLFEGSCFSRTTGNIWKSAWKSSFTKCDSQETLDFQGQYEDALNDFLRYFKSPKKLCLKASWKIFSIFLLLIYWNSLIHVQNSEWLTNYSHVEIYFMCT